MHPDDIWSNAIFDAVNDRYGQDVSFALDGIKQLTDEIRDYAEGFGAENNIDSVEIKGFREVINDTIDAMELEVDELEDIADAISLDIVEDIKNGVLDESLMNDDKYIDRARIKEHALETISFKYYLL